MNNHKNIEYKAILKVRVGRKQQVEYIQTKRRHSTAQHTADQHSVYNVILKNCRVK